MVAKLALGSAAFGMAYGIARSRDAAVEPKEVRRILLTGRAAGLDMIDTAVAYGDAEQVLGQVGLEGWRIVSKIGQVPQDAVDLASWVEGSVRNSLNRLGIGQLHALLLHDVSQLLGQNGQRIAQALRRLVDIGLVTRIGVSIYGPDQLERICQVIEPGLVQVPFNPLDRRIETSGWADRLSSMGTEIHVRSVFLQGAMLMPRDARLARFAKWAPVWDAWDEWQNRSKLSARDLCLSLSLSRPWAHNVIVGVENAVQLEQLIAAPHKTPIAPPDLLTYGVTDTRLIDPFNWSRS